METLCLKEKAKQIRMSIINMIAAANSGHPGGSLSCSDILTVLYFDKMKIDHERPKCPERDRFVLSKGHASPALYATLAERGFFSKKELSSFRKYGSSLQGHPDMKSTPGVDMTTGSLGQGLSAANGMALAAKLDQRDYKVYVMLGDGEIQEGQIWEAVMTAAHYKLDNVIAILDYNGLQIDGPVAKVMNADPLTGKFESFGWHTIYVDGHDLEQIGNAIEFAKENKGRPTIIIAKTIKGKGVSFMENQAGWHGTAPNEEQRRKAIEEIEGGVLL